MTTKIIQVAYVVNSLRERCEQLLKTFDIGPFLYAPNLELVEHKLWGQPSDPFFVDAAFAQSGDLNIEILELKSPGPNALNLMYGGDREGVHHVSYFCEDVEAEKKRLTALGCPPVSEFRLGEVNLCFCDTRKLFGHLVELYEKHQDLRTLYERTRNLRAGWDGKTLFYNL